MFAYVFTDGLTRMQRGLQRLANPSAWMEPLLQQGILIILDDNRDNLLAGRDIRGGTFAPVQRKHGGPPLLRKQYRAIHFAVADAAQLSRKDFEIRLSWPQFKSRGGRDILAMHMRPYRNRPARPAVGIRPTAVAEFNQAARRFLGRELSAFMNTPNVATGAEQFSGVIRGRR